MASNADEGNFLLSFKYKRLRCQSHTVRFEGVHVVKWWFIQFF